MSFSIAGKTAIVTGSANGFGLAIARHFADQGANVMCADIDEAGLVEQHGDAASEDDSRIRYFAGDLCQKLTVANLMSATIDAFDGVDILVNASRRIIQCSPLNPGEDGVQEMLQQNLMTSLRMTQQIAKWMIDHDTDTEDRTGSLGSIINLSSIAATRTQPELLAYSVSCAAVEQMTRSMAVALAPNRIRVNAVAFGSVLSSSLQDALGEEPGKREEVIEATPLGRIASTAEVVETVRFLASEGSQFMTGQILTVDGGRGLLDSVRLAAH